MEIRKYNTLVRFISSDYLKNIQLQKRNKTKRDTFRSKARTFVLKGKFGYCAKFYTHEHYLLVTAFTIQCK